MWSVSKWLGTAGKMWWIRIPGFSSRAALKHPLSLKKIKDTKYTKHWRKSEDYRMEVKLYFLVLILHCNNNSMCKIHSPKILLVHPKTEIIFQICLFDFSIYCLLYLLALNLLCFIFSIKSSFWFLSLLSYCTSN